MEATRQAEPRVSTTSASNLSYTSYTSSRNSDTRRLSDARRAHSLQGLIEGEYKAMYTHANFAQYITQFYAQESFNFLVRFRDYQTRAQHIFTGITDAYCLPETLAKTLEEGFSAPSKPAGMSDAEFKRTLDTLRELCDGIFQTFISEDAPHEVSLTYAVRCRLAEDIKWKTLHPNVFLHAFAQVMLDLNHNYWNGFVVDCVSKTQKQSNRMSWANVDKVKAAQAYHASHGQADLGTSNPPRKVSIQLVGRGGRGSIIVAKKPASQNIPEVHNNGARRGSYLEMVINRVTGSSKHSNNNINVEDKDLSATAIAKLTLSPNDE